MFEMNQHKLITGIMPKGKGVDILKKLKVEKDIITANIDSARGMGHLTPQAHRGVGEQSEKEILTVVIEKHRADEIFEYIYEIAEIDKPHGGMIFMTRLLMSSPYVLPDLPDES